MKTLFRKDNLGCKLAVSQGMVLSMKRRVLFLRMIAYHHRAFLGCGKLLTLYKYNSDIWHISGATVNNKIDPTSSYHFSIYRGIWGWATWANRWRSYDASLDYSQEVLARLSKSTGFLILIGHVFLLESKWVILILGTINGYSIFG